MNDAAQAKRPAISSPPRAFPTARVEKIVEGLRTGEPSIAVLTMGAHGHGLFLSAGGLQYDESEIVIEELANLR